MAIYWPTPGFKGRTFKLCVLTRWDFYFCVRSSPLRGINILTNKTSYTNAMNDSDISPDILNNHFCNVHGKVITTDMSSNNSFIALKQYCKERIRHKGKPFPFMTVCGVFTSLSHRKQSSTKATDGIDGKTSSLWSFHHWYYYLHI